MDTIVTPDPPSQHAFIDNADDRAPHERLPHEDRHRPYPDGHSYNNNNRPHRNRVGYRGNNPRQQQDERRDTRRHTNPPPISDSVDVAGEPTSPDNENRDHHGSPTDSRSHREDFHGDGSRGGDYRGGDHRGGNYRDRGPPSDSRSPRDGHRNGGYRNDGFRNDGRPRDHDQRDNGRGYSGYSRDPVARLKSTVYHMKKSASEELTRFNETLRAKDDAIADLKEQEAKLRQAHPFLTSDDRCSGTDVKQLVETLNYEINQIATAAAQYFGEKHDADGEKILDEDRLDAIDKVKKIVGAKLCQELESCNHKDDFTLLQLALQAIFCHSSKRFVESWDDGVFNGLSDHLTHIYNKMKMTEPQSVLALWRALTQRQMNAIVAEDHPESRFVPSLIKNIQRLATVSRVQQSELQSYLASTLSEKLDNLELHLRRIRNAVTLDFVSGDFELVSVHPDKTFDETLMTDTFGSKQEIQTRTQVACTTGLGLRMTKKVAKGEEYVDESLDLLLVQVLLESSLEEFLQ